MLRLELSALTKRFAGVTANDAVSLAVKPGEIHAVLGENGAGKSTLMKMIVGLYAPDEGSVSFNGSPVTIHSPFAAQQLGIAMVHQHFALFETLTVAENIALALPGFDIRTLSQEISAISNRYGLPIEPARYVHTMSVGERQRVEIVRCLLQKPQLLIMDEPTSVLTPQAVRQLFEVLRQLAREGCSIIYISHKLDEVRELCDAATVLRGGKNVGQLDPKTASSQALAELMIGHSLPKVAPRQGQSGEVVLALNNLNQAAPSPFATRLSGIHLKLKAGQILGIAGVSGNGQAELLKAISGETLSDNQSVSIFNQHAGQLNAGQRRALGLGFVPEERLGRGAVPPLSLAQNVPLTGWQSGLGLVSRFGLLNFKAAQAFAAQTVSAFDVRCSGTNAAAKSLSGGNLQKFIVGREIRLAPKIMVLAQPTWGVDVGAASFIRQQMLDLASSGVAVLVVSDELEELFEVCDDIAVMFQGQLSAPLKVKDTNPQAVGLLMAGAAV